MREKFQGKVLTEAMRRLDMFVGHSNEADRAAECCTVEEFPANQTIITQGDDSWDVYFLLQGKCEIFVNGRSVGIRVAGQHVGEMAPLLRDRRTATVRTLLPTVVAKVSGDFFRDLAEAIPGLWRNAAYTLAQRLDARKQFLREPNSRPLIFVASSSESKPVLDVVVEKLRAHGWDVRPWTSPEVFQPMGVTILSLIEASQAVDFAVAIFGNDDELTIRTEIKSAPRDNVVFEAGLFTGAIGLDRTFVLKPDTANYRVLTDLLGVTLLPYKVCAGVPDVEDAVQSIAEAVRKKECR